MSAVYKDQGIEPRILGDLMDILRQSGPINFRRIGDRAVMSVSDAVSQLILDADVHTWEAHNEQLDLIKRLYAETPSAQQGAFVRALVSRINMPNAARVIVHAIVDLREISSIAQWDKLVRPRSRFGRGLLQNCQLNTPGLPPRISAAFRAPLRYKFRVTETDAVRRIGTQPGIHDSDRG